MRIKWVCSWRVWSEYKNSCKRDKRPVEELSEAVPVLLLVPMKCGLGFLETCHLLWNKKIPPLCTFIKSDCPSLPSIYPICLQFNSTKHSVIPCCGMSCPNILLQQETHYINDVKIHRALVACILCIFLTCSRCLTVFWFYSQEPLCRRNVKETKNKGRVFPASMDRPTRSTPTGWTAVCPAHTAAQVTRLPASWRVFHN